MTIRFEELDFNPEFQRAFEALENTRDHIFVTGKAGTGKSTLLHYFRSRTQKQVAVLAPTGVAAIHIQGQTIHSFFQFKPDITPASVREIVLRRSKKAMFKNIDALIIDEISMVRCDLLDCIDMFLRLHGPRADAPFGGIQMIFFGDLFQLPPIVHREQEDVFKTLYESPYFFAANAIKDIQLQRIELTQVYRQKDERFIRLLNAIRKNDIDEHHWDMLNARLNGKNLGQDAGVSVTLTTTNAVGDRINMQQMSSLPGKIRMYTGIIEGEFDQKSLPAPGQLLLKEQTQVMMLNNDAEKRWVNGSLGVIVAIKSTDEGQDIICVQLNNGDIVDVKLHTWEIYRYYFDEIEETLMSETVGFFTQYPLKAAWAVTIHKSQGQTFDHVVIDIGSGTFAYGQMYVALSRCRTLEGVVLKQPLKPHHIKVDERILEFDQKK